MAGPEGWWADLREEKSHQSFICDPYTVPLKLE